MSDPTITDEDREAARAIFYMADAVDRIARLVAKNRASGRAERDVAFEALQADLSDYQDERNDAVHREDEMHTRCETLEAELKTYRRFMGDGADGETIAELASARARIAILEAERDEARAKIARFIGEEEEGPDAWAAGLRDERDEARALLKEAETARDAWMQEALEALPFVSTALQWAPHPSRIHSDGAAWYARVEAKEPDADVVTERDEALAQVEALSEALRELEADTQGNWGRSEETARKLPSSHRDFMYYKGAAAAAKELWMLVSSGVAEALSGTGTPRTGGGGELHRLVCERCKKPITKDQAYAEVRVPDGEKVPVHEECMK